MNVDFPLHLVGRSALPLLTNLRLLFLLSLTGVRKLHIQYMLFPRNIFSILYCFAFGDVEMYSFITLPTLYQVLWRSPAHKEGTS